MSFTIILAGESKVELLDVDDEKISEFFKQERNIFSGKLTDLLPAIQRSIEALVGKTDRLGYTHVFTLARLAGERMRPDVLEFIKFCQEKYSSKYLIAK